MSNGKKIYLITGCNRGIGRAIADIILARPNTTLIALVRDPSSETSQSLVTEAEGRANNSNVVLLPYDASDPTSAGQAISLIRKDHNNVKRIDVAIANAGMASYFGPSTMAEPQLYLQHYMVNALGPLTLFTAFLPLLRQGQQDSRGHESQETEAQNEHKSKFIVISSAAGSTALSSTIADRLRSGRAALPYGMSKAALNHSIARLRFEHPDIAFRILTPGVTKTDFGGGLVDWDNLPHALSVGEVVPLLMQLIDDLVDNIDGENVEFLNWKGDTVPW